MASRGVFLVGKNPTLSHEDVFRRFSHPFYLIKIATSEKPTINWGGSDVVINQLNTQPERV